MTIKLKNITPIVNEKLQHGWGNIEDWEEMFTVNINGKFIYITSIQNENKLKIITTDGDIELVANNCDGFTPEFIFDGEEKYELQFKIKRHYDK